MTDLVPGIADTFVPDELPGRDIPGITILSIEPVSVPRDRLQAMLYEVARDVSSAAKQLMEWLVTSCLEGQRKFIQCFDEGRRTRDGPEDVDMILTDLLPVIDWEAFGLWVDVDWEDRSDLDPENVPISEVSVGQLLTAARLNAHLGEDNIAKVQVDLDAAAASHHLNRGEQALLWLDHACAGAILHDDVTMRQMVAEACVELGLQPGLLDVVAFKNMDIRYRLALDNAFGLFRPRHFKLARISPRPWRRDLRHLALYHHEHDEEQMRDEMLEALEKSSRDQRHKGDLELRKLVATTLLDTDQAASRLEEHLGFIASTLRPAARLEAALGFKIGCLEAGAEHELIAACNETIDQLLSAGMPLVPDVGAYAWTLLGNEREGEASSEALFLEAQNGVTSRPAGDTLVTQRLVKMLHQLVRAGPRPLTMTWVEQIERRLRQELDSSVYPIGIEIAGDWAVTVLELAPLLEDDERQELIERVQSLLEVIPVPLRGGEFYKPAQAACRIMRLLAEWHGAAALEQINEVATMAQRFVEQAVSRGRALPQKLIEPAVFDTARCGLLLGAEVYLSVALQWVQQEAQFNRGRAWSRIAAMMASTLDSN